MHTPQKHSNINALRRLVAACTVYALAAGAAYVDKARADEDRIIEQIMRDWQRRRERLTAVRYRLSGSRVWYLDHYNDDLDFISSGAEPRKEKPTGQAKGAVTQSVLLDFSNNRHCIEWDELKCDTTDGQMYRVRCRSVFDGQEAAYSQIFENSDPSLRPGQEKRHVDVLIKRGEMPLGVFGFEYTALFLGHGRVAYNFVRVGPGRLTPELNPKDFSYVRDEMYRGRSCVVLRTPKSIYGQQQFCVDPQMESAVVKIANAPQRPNFVLEIQYAAADDGWLPKNWNVTSYNGRHVRFTEHVTVNEITRRPRGADDDFRIQLRPGMYVQDNCYVKDLETGEQRQDRSYYRLEANGNKTPLDEETLLPIARAVGEQTMNDPNPYSVASTSADGAVPDAVACPKCGGEMQAGLSCDVTRKKPLFWIEGTETSWWGLPRWSQRKAYVQESYRCEVCGYVEVYAKEPL